MHPGINLHHPSNDIDIENNTKNCDTASDIDDINKCCPKDVMES